jgi:hypothetical protein
MTTGSLSSLQEMIRESTRSDVRGTGEVGECFVHFAAHEKAA